MAESNGTKRKLSDEEEESVKKLKPGTESGTLLFSGLSNYDDRNSLGPKLESLLWSPHRFESLEGVRIKEVSSGPVSYFFLAISEEGKVYSCGFNQCGELGLGDFKTRRNPTLMQYMEDYNVVAVATGRQHSLLLTDTGDVYSCGDNKCGQCGIGQKKEKISKPQRIDYTGSPITKIACGDDFSLILNEDGEVYSFGSPEHGQLGLGSESKEIQKRKEVFHYSYSPTEVTAYIEVDDGEVVSHGQPRITQIATGPNHCCVIDDQKRIFTWGFGGYGRLGHNNTKNELLPRLMKCWYRVTGRADGGVTRVYCGGQFNIVQTIIEKCAYMFGQFHRNAEANMYPKFIEDLQGWNIRSIVCNQFGWFVCADDSVIASQPSPGWGQLAMGEKKKASAPPIIVTTLKDVYCHSAGVGYLHSCFIVRDTSDKDKKEIEKFPTVSYDEPTAEVEEVVEKSNGKKGPKPKGKGKKK